MTPPVQPHRLGAKEAARPIQRGGLTAQALVESRLERIAARDAEVRAWVCLNREIDYSQALAPLNGVPVGVKDIFDTHDLVAMNVVWTLLHAPCVSVPAMRSAAGLPLGLQVIGRIGDDARTVACAQWIEGVLK